MPAFMAARASRPIWRPTSFQRVRLKLMPVVMGKGNLVVSVFLADATPEEASDHQLYLQGRHMCLDCLDHSLCQEFEALPVLGETSRFIQAFNLAHLHEPGCSDHPSCLPIKAMISSLVRLRRVGNFGRIWETRGKRMGNPRETYGTNKKFPSRHLVEAVVFGPKLGMVRKFRKLVQKVQKHQTKYP